MKIKPNNYIVSNSVNASFVVEAYAIFLWCVVEACLFRYYCIIYAGSDPGKI